MSDVLGTITQTLEKSLTTKQVFGEAVEIGGVTMVPVMDLSFGFGGGSGEGRDEKGQGGVGGGGGGAARLAPKAILVIKDGTVNVMPIGKGAAIDKILEAAPAIFEKLAAKKGEGEAKAEEKAE